MRRIGFFCVSFVLACAQAAQAPPTSGNGGALPPLPALLGNVSPAPADATLAASPLAPLPANFGAAALAHYVRQRDPMANFQLAALMPERRTAAQLEAILAGYVGRWQGEVSLRMINVSRIVTFPIEMAYSIETRDGRKSLVCVTNYEFNGRKVTERQRMWVQDGRLLAETTGNGATRRFFVFTEGDRLLWMLNDPSRTPLDYFHTETLKLTADGGTLSIRDFEAVPSPLGPTYMSQLCEMKLVK